MEKIHSEIIGNLYRKNENEDWKSEKDIAIPFLNNIKLPVFYYLDSIEKDTSFEKEADEALKNILQLKKPEILEVAKHLFENLQEFKSLVGLNDVTPELRNLTNEIEIWKYINPSCLTVERRAYEDKNIYVVIPCNCDWEEEHGLQMVFRKGKILTRVSDIDGHLTNADAFDIPDKEDNLLNRFID